jgi:hypothetical protein
MEIANECSRNFSMSAADVVTFSPDTLDLVSSWRLLGWSSEDMAYHTWSRVHLDLEFGAKTQGKIMPRGGDFKWNGPDPQRLSMLQPL